MRSPARHSSPTDSWLLDDRAPIAGATATPQAVRLGEPVTFVGSGTTDPDLEDPIVDYEWTFGDGARAHGARVTHAFAFPGAHRATLTVTDSSGRTGSVEVPVIVLAPTPLTSLPTKVRRIAG